MPSPRFSLLVFAALLAITLLAGEAASLLPPSLRGPHALYVTSLQPHWVDRFFQWDALWYERVATAGYGWRPAGAAHEQTMAFFPLWPLLLRAAAWPGLPPLAQRWLVALLASAIAAGSVHAFQRLALRVLAPAPARLATLFYAFWPASLFLLQSYPTGLINLLVIVGLECLLRKRVAAAAACSAAATAGGPLAVGFAATIGVTLALRAHAHAHAHAHARAAGRPAAFFLGLLRATPTALLAVAGLLAFMAWQAARFGDPLAFIEAQRAWDPAVQPGLHALRFALMCLVVPEIAQAAASLAAALRFARTHALPGAQEQVENAINLLGLAIALLLLPAMRRLRQPAVTGQAALTMALYLWFIAAEHGGWATLRLIFPIPGLFLALGQLLHGRRWAAAAALAASALLLALHAFLMNAGYGVI